jgi:hypothetical protein
VDVYVKMPVDDRTDVERVRRGARLVADAIPRATLFLQPVTSAESGEWRTSAHRLFELAAPRARRDAAHVRRPQLHKLMGIR